jgi:hypothetical protein
MTSVIRRWNGTIWVDVLVNTDTIADGAVTAAKLSAPVLPLAGGTLTGPLTVSLASASAPGVLVNSSTATPSDRASVQLGSWVLGQDAALNGIRDFFIYDGTAAQNRVQISTAGEVGVGVVYETAVKLKVNGNTKILTGAGAGDAGLAIIETTHATSARASVVTGGWQIGQDFVGQGVRDFFIYDATAGAARLKIDVNGATGIGADPETGFSLKLGFALKTGAGDKMLRIPEDPGQASARASMVIGDWEIGQDVAINSVRDWYLYGIAGLTAMAQTGGSFYFKQLSSGMTLNYRRGGAVHAGTWARGEFHKFGRRVLGSARINITDIATGQGEIDVTFAGMGAPVYTMACGIGGYYDDDVTNGHIPLIVWVSPTGRFFFIRSDEPTDGFQHLGTDPSPGSDCAGDWLEFEFSFPVSTDF